MRGKECSKDEEEKGVLDVERKGRGLSEAEMKLIEELLSPDLSTFE